LVECLADERSPATDALLNLVAGHRPVVADEPDDPLAALIVGLDDRLKNRHRP